jgi:CxxC motif-containing protein (DUF1111 family)
VPGVYSDFLLHRLDDRDGPGGSSHGQEAPEVPFPADQPSPEECKTSPLWGVADSAPYLHDGGAPTLRHGGDAAKVTRAYKGLPKKDQEAVVLFLKTLKAPPEAVPVKGAALPRPIASR